MTPSETEGGSSHSIAAIAAEVLTEIRPSPWIGHSPWNDGVAGSLHDSTAALGVCAAHGLTERGRPSLLTDLACALAARRRPGPRSLPAWIGGVSAPSRSFADRPPDRSNGMARTASASSYTVASARRTWVVEPVRVSPERWGLDDGREPRQELAGSPPTNARGGEGVTYATAHRAHAPAFEERYGRESRCVPIAAADLLSAWVRERRFDDETVAPGAHADAGPGMRIEASEGAPATLDRPPLPRLRRRPVRSRREKRQVARAGGGDEASSCEGDEGGDECGRTVH